MGANLEQLPEGFSYQDDNESALPEGFTYAKEKSLWGDKKPDYGIDVALKTSESDPNMPWYERLYHNFGKAMAVNAVVSGGGGKQALPVYEEAGKEFASKATLGLTENIPGMKPIDIEQLPEAEREGLSVVKLGAGLPAEFMVLNKLMKVWGLPAYSEKGATVAQKAVKSLSNVFRAFGVGATEEGIKEIFKGEVPDMGDIIKNGATWAALEGMLQVGGKAAEGIKAAFQKNIESGANPYELVNKFTDDLIQKGVPIDNIEAVSKEALEYFGAESAANEAKAASSEYKAAELRGRVARPETIEEIKAKIPEEPSPISVKDRFEPEAAKPLEEETLDVFAPRAGSSQELGENTVKDIAQKVELAKAEYQPAYELAKEASIGINPNANRVIKKAEEMRQQLGGNLKTRPPDYDKTIGIIEGIMEDLGAVWDSNGKLLLSEEGALPIDRLMDLKIRTGQLAKYGDITPSVRDKVKVINQDIKKLILDSLESNPEAKKMYEYAENTFREKSALYDNPTILKMRGRDFNAENIGTLIKKPSELERIKKAVSPQQYKQVERELLSQMNQESYEKASKMYRELQRHMSEDARKLADEVLLSKKPVAKLTPKDKAEKLEKWVTDQLAKPKKSGELLKEWSNPQSNQRIRNALKKNPNRDEIINYLNDEALYQASKKFTHPDGSLNWNKFKDFIHDSGGRRALRDQVGEEGIKFFDYMTRNVDKFKKQRRIFEQLNNLPIKNFNVPSEIGNQKLKEFAGRVADLKKNPALEKVKEMWNFLPQETKTILTTVGVMSLGLGKAATLGGFALLKAVASTPRARNAFRKAISAETTNPYKLFALWEAVTNS